MNAPLFFDELYCAAREQAARERDAVFWLLQRDRIDRRIAQLREQIAECEQLRAIAAQTYEIISAPPGQTARGDGTD